MSNYPLGANEDMNAPWHNQDENLTDCPECGGEGLDDFGICEKCKGDGLIIKTEEMIEDERLNAELDEYDLMHDNL